MCCFLSGRIVTKSNQPQSIGYPFGIIEMEESDRRTPTGGNAFNQTTVEAKMAMPSLSAWLEEEDGFLLCWVDGSKV